MGSKSDEISERFLDFAVRVIKVADSLRRTPSGRLIAAQIARSGTSAGANYEEARAAESQNDFIHKLGICLKELRETHYWLRIITKAEMHPRNRMESITREAEELSRIVGKSIVTTKTKARANGRITTQVPAVNES